MALIIPTGTSTFGDSTSTEGGRLRKYVLAQFRSDAELDWVKELRGRLVKDELKYADFKAARPRFRQDRSLWARVQRGVGQASIVIIDPAPVEADIRQAVEAEVGRREPAAVREKAITEACATAIVATTPIAYLPLNLARAIPWGAYDLLASLDAYTPQQIRSRIGGGLKQAQIFAARAHAVFDLTSASDTIVVTDAVFRSPLAPVMLAELVSTVRAYDEESPATLDVLNEAANEIALALEQGFPGWVEAGPSPLIREVSSRAIDEIQAADIAAGWVRDALEVGDIPSLGAQFERVWANGVASSSGPLHQKPLAANGGRWDDGGIVPRSCSPIRSQWPRSRQSGLAPR